MQRDSTTACLWCSRIAGAILALAPCVLAASGGPPGDAGTPAAAFAEFVASRDSGLDVAAEDALARLAALPHAQVRAVLEQAAAPGRGAEEARAGLALLGRAGDSSDLPLAPLLARPGSEDDLERAVLAVARRDARSLAVLDVVARSVTPDVRLAILKAVEGLGSLEAASWIARCAERKPDIRPEALARLGRLAQALPHPAPEDALAVVRGVLGGLGAESLRDAVIAAGRMEDGEAIPYLIPLLREDDRGLRADAAWALERISGLHLRDRAERWEAWCAAEQAWWCDRADAAFAGLESADPAARTHALLEIAGKRMSRDRLSLRVLPLLEDPDAAVAALAAQTLRGLCSKVACAALVRALERPEPAVGGEAWQALRAITRKDLPLDAAAWRATCAR